jgi:very-short-patch-repair endonuclease
MFPTRALPIYAAAKLVSTPEGCARARSAAEAFLYRRLETLPVTTGRFRLNARLPIQFDDRGEMEIDLLDAAARLAIELDGPQHLADPDAYRRDRRKDLILQEHGYIVLRFLAEDVGLRLGWVLETVTRILTTRKREFPDNG